MRDGYKFFLYAMEETNSKNKKSSERMANSGDPHQQDFGRLMQKLEEGDQLLMMMPPFPELKIKLHLDLLILINFQIHKRPNTENDANGWFSASAQDLSEYANMGDASKQSQSLKKLELAGFIKKKTRGIPPTREIWIDLDKFLNRHLEVHNGKKKARKVK